MENTDDPFRNPGLSSPIILVFMAIGVCCAAGLSFFAWRRWILAHNHPAVFQTHPNPNLTGMRSPRYWTRSEAEPDATGARGLGFDVGRKPVLFDLWTSGGSSDWGQILPLSLTFTTNNECTHLSTPSLSSSVKTHDQSSNITIDHDIDTRETAQIALSIAFPDEYRKGQLSLGQYAIGVTDVDIVTTVNKS
ncbi:hypothetical protein E1B28_005780 [Marasmius oreades]|uniref:Uncharacterized protein n=1 Tax=Marasmius oreades TaxID=181124 RepID=A0A9P7UUY0_9AGAR|nr:uncharacterized protein E1B28_005780 [Marasmius oreades]KAG7094983.1 hypothetical protein E1B28_005780 [Marasmius oreades]